MEKFPKDELYSRYNGLVMAIVNKYVNHRDDRDDLISEGLLGLVKAYNAVDWNRSSKFESYAYPIINNCILDYLRGKKKRYLHYIPFDAKVKDIGEDITVGDTIAYEVDYTRLLVDEFMSTLSSYHREMLELKIEYKNQAEVARHFGVNRCMVSKNISKIRKHYVDTIGVR